MTREELIDHLEHLERYTHYSEDAPALREVIEMLKCSEMPNSTEERTKTHACDLISRLSEIRSQYNCFNESEEPYYRALSEVIKKLSEQADGDTISRQRK